MERRMQLARRVEPNGKLATTLGKAERPDWRYAENALMKNHEKEDYSHFPDSRLLVKHLRR